MAEDRLLLYLDAPLQSWGYQSRFDRRTSLSHPTRSGIMGMICAAVGIERSDVPGLERLDGLRFTVYRFGGGGRLVDYHTVGGGYDKKRQLQSMPRKANDGARDTVLTYRDYLQDTRFGVLIEGDGGLLAEVARALGDPRWGVWLGRKSCIPTSPVCQGFFATEGAAVEHLSVLEAARPAWGRGEDTGRPLRRYTEVADFAAGTDTLMDRPLDFAARRFAPRRVAEE